MTPIRIGTRGSRLALWQAQRVVELLRRTRPDSVYEIVTISTKGDEIPDQPLPEVGGEGLFTRRIESALSAGEVDVAVHSLKDLPIDDPEGLVVAAVIGREEVREVLISRGGMTLSELPPGAVVGSSSTRRRAQLLCARPDLVVRPIRGNVETRIAKVHRGDYDATILAGVGVMRLGCGESISEWLPLDDFLPAPGQGAVAAQCRAEDKATRAILSAIDEPVHRAETAAERGFLRALGGGCAAPVAAYAEAGAARDGEGFHVRLRGRVCSPDGGKVIDVVGEGDDPAALAAALVRRALDAGAALLIEAARGGDATTGGNATSGGEATPELAREAAPRLAQEAAPAGASGQGALRGKRILITRPLEQSARLAQMLSALGAVPIVVPLIRIEPVEENARLDEAIRQLSAFRWIVFTSCNAVEVFCRRAAALGVALSAPGVAPAATGGRGGGAEGGVTRPKIAAVGPGTAECLAGFGCAADFVPETHTAVALAHSLMSFGREKISGARILIPRARGGREEAAAALRGLGAAVEDIPIYSTEAAEIQDTDLAGISEGIDAILFMSGSAVKAFCEGARVHAGLAAAARGALIACIGPTTREAAVAAGLPVAITAAEHTAEGLVSALADSFARTPAAGRPGAEQRAARPPAAGRLRAP